MTARIDLRGARALVTGATGGLGQAIARRVDVLGLTGLVLFVAMSIFSAGFPGTVVYIILWLITKPHSMRDEFPG